MLVIDSLEAVKAIYRRAIDVRASDGEPASWWRAVAAEVREVVSAPSDPDAASVIAWWHDDWTCVPDTPLAAARRIRRAARSLKTQKDV